MDGQVTLVYVDTLTEGGVCATGPSWRIHGWPSNFGVRGYFDRGGGGMCNRSSLEDPWMAK